MCWAKKKQTKRSVGGGIEHAAPTDERKVDSGNNTIIRNPHALLEVGGHLEVDGVIGK